MAGREEKTLYKGWPTPNSGKPWTAAEVRHACGYDNGGKYRSIEKVARKLGRTYNAVAQAQAKARWARRFEQELF
jgi:hypothetical protein